VFQLPDPLLLSSEEIADAQLPIRFRFVLLQPPTDRGLTNIDALADMSHAQTLLFNHAYDVELEAGVDDSSLLSH
jgi:hypothetical protein